jgi:hypothetical protein
MRRDELHVVGEVQRQPDCEVHSLLGGEEVTALEALLRLHRSSPRHRFIGVRVRHTIMDVCIY